MPTSLKIDHVTIAGPALAAMERAFADLGLQTDYGGAHSNGVTHMALLGFNDGSYIELISSLKPELSATIFWGDHIAGNGGPCAWAIQVDDIAAEAARVAALGIAVEGPVYMNRRRPDGKLVEWHLAFLGDKGAGATLPFMIKDITPHEWRVLPSASVTGQLSGVAMVILGVKNLDGAVELFRGVYGWPAPQLKEDAIFGARLAYFANAPITLAEPLEEGDWLSTRLTRFGESPCAYFLSATHFEVACHNFGLAASATWFNRSVAWFDPAKLNGVKLGLIA